MNGIKRKIDLGISPYKFVNLVISTGDAKDCTKREREVLDKLKAVGGTMGDLCQKTEEDLYGKVYINQENLDALEKILDWYGLHLGMHPKALEEYDNATLITPDFAAALLERNAHNRPYFKPVAKRYAQAMEKGLWRIDSGEPIAIDWNGELANGQHRLNAVIISGLSQLMEIKPDVNPEDFRVMDTGKNRSPADILAILGIMDARNTAAAIGAYLLLRAKRIIKVDGTGSGTQGLRALERKIQYFNTDTSDNYFTHEDLWRRAIRLGERVNRALKYIGRKTVAGMYAYLILDLGYAEDDVLGFFNAWVDNTGGATIKALRKRFSDNENALKWDKMKEEPKQKCIILAWNAWVTGKTLRTITPLADEKIWFLPNQRARKTASGKGTITLKP